MDPTDSVAFNRILKSGELFSSIGVGTVIINILHLFKLSNCELKIRLDDDFI